MGLFNFLKRKEKKFPKVIIFVGIMGVGKTTLIKNVFRGLHGHEYTLDIEDHSHLIERFAESGNDFSINKYDFKRIKKIRDILKDKTEKKNLFPRVRARTLRKNVFKFGHFHTFKRLKKKKKNDFLK